MKRIILSVLSFAAVISLNSQGTKTEVLQDLEKNQGQAQTVITTATVKSATRLFKDKDDLTSVILVIPQDSIVYLIGADSTFLHVGYKGNEGFIYSRHASLNKPSVSPSENFETPVAAQIQEGTPVRESTISRYEYLEKKYGTTMAERIYAHKIWKGMNAQMVKDSWGSPRKIDRIISGNMVKEEWFYNSTRLSFQNSTLLQWGPVK